MNRRTKILVCVDKAEHSKTAVRFACAKAKQLNCPIELLHVLNPSEYHTLFSVGEKMKSERWAEAEVLMNNLAEEANKSAGITPVFMIREGLISEETIKVLDEDPNISMLIIGKAPKEAGKKDLISMLTSELASKIMIPMMIVPGNLTAKQIEELT